VTAGLPRLVGRRLVALVGVLAALTFFVFIIQAVLPTDPVKAFFGRHASPEVLAAKKAELGYDDPLPQQYAAFVGRLAAGDLGTSLRTRRPVLDDIGEFLPATAELATVAGLFAAAGGLALGVIGSRRGAGASAVRVASVMGSSAPTFLVGIVGILVFYRSLGWLPATGRGDPVPGPTSWYLVNATLALDPAAWWDAFLHLLMPAVALAIGPAVAIGRTLRGSLRDALRDDHVRLARAKGLGEGRILARHALRNAAGPGLSMGGLQVGLLLAGAVVVESVFSWPGIGLYLNQAIEASDFPAVIGVVLVLGTAYVVINALVDVAQVVADPRQRSAQA
jgi:peptide/nickel transport system permease protein